MFSSKNSEAVILDAIVWKRSNLTTIRNESLSGTDLFQEGIVQPMNNITISETNSMVIKGTTEVHSNQLYECRDNRTDTSFGYLLIVWQEKPSAKFGNLADWSEYRENVVEPTNRILQSVKILSLKKISWSSSLFFRLIPIQTTSTQSCFSSGRSGNLVFADQQNTVQTISIAMETVPFWYTNISIWLTQLLSTKFYCPVIHRLDS